jgi:hypothetical protein
MMGDRINQRDLLNTGRYLLLLDILGFSELVESKGTQEIYALVDNALGVFNRWEKLNGLFKTIYFSDTFVLYQEHGGYSSRVFLDVYALGAMLLAALLADGIPARGAISFGEFEVNADSTRRHQIYFGKALVDAHKAEQSEKWVGITILPAAWEPFEAEKPGLIAAFEGEKVWSKRSDGVLLLNPFIKLRTYYSDLLADGVCKPYCQWDAPEFPNDILGLKFLRDKSEMYASQNDFTSPIAIKYHVTIRFLEQIMGKEFYSWAADASLPINFLPSKDV